MFNFIKPDWDQEGTFPTDSAMQNVDGLSLPEAHFDICGMFSSHGRQDQSLAKSMESCHFLQ